MGPTCVCALTVDGVTLYVAPGLFLFQRQGNWDSERSSNFPRAAQLPRVGATFPDPSEQMALEPLLIAPVVLQPHLKFPSAFLTIIGNDLLFMLLQICCK